MAAKSNKRRVALRKPSICVRVRPLAESGGHSGNVTATTPENRTPNPFTHTRQHYSLQRPAPIPHYALPHTRRYVLGLTQTRSLTRRYVLGLTQTRSLTRLALTPRAFHGPTCFLPLDRERTGGVQAPRGVAGRRRDLGRPARAGELHIPRGHSGHRRDAGGGIRAGRGTSGPVLLRPSRRGLQRSTFRLWTDGYREDVRHRGSNHSGSSHPHPGILDTGTISVVIHVF